MAEANQCDRKEASGHFELENKQNKSTVRNVQCYSYDVHRTLYRQYNRKYSTVLYDVRC